MAAAPKRPDFFNVYIPSFNSERLTIPIGFVQYMEGRTSGSARLTGPSRNAWPVKLVEKEHCMFFEEGWPEFVKDHHMKIGEFFHFHYDGDLSFTVVIYDQTACEKESAFSAKISQPKPEEKKKSKMKASDTSSCYMLGVQGSSEKGEEAAKSFTSKHPYFVALIKPYNINRSHILFLPVSFLRKHQLNYESNDKIVLLNQKGKSQRVNVIRSKRGSFLCAGWINFARISDIKEGDTCIFEAVDKYEMHVHKVSFIE